MIQTLFVYLCRLNMQFSAVYPSGFNRLLTSRLTNIPCNLRCCHLSD